jgi:peptide/nickel transport system ATP-binding protein
MTKPVISVSGLQVSYRHGGGWLRVLDGVDFSISRGEVLGLVGESGCGKSTVGLQLLAYRQPNMRVDAGTVSFGETDLLRLGRRQLDRVRGNRIGFVPQNPTTALNPAIRIGGQVIEPLFLHGKVSSAAEATERAERLLALVGLPDPKALLSRYPHQLSGGQQQRVCIAIAIACDPDLIVLDEPTTGLDVTTQEQIVGLLADLRTRLGTAMLYVTHDLALLAQIADRVGVMYAGHLVETAPSAALFASPRHPYTQGLIASLPRIEDPPDTPRSIPLQGGLRRGDLPSGCAFAPRCPIAEESCFERRQVLAEVAAGHEVACQRWPHALPITGSSALVYLRPQSRDTAPEPILKLDDVTIAYGNAGTIWSRLFAPTPFIAVRGLSLAIARGETLALVGESGSGKSTVARAISGLLPPRSGTIRFNGAALSPSYSRRDPEARRLIQYVFQNPDASLNPRKPVGRILARPLAYFFRMSRGRAAEHVMEALRDVQLDAVYARRYADELSGGERQRVAIARAIVARPDLLLCDEVLSALDVSVQANIIELLRRLRVEHNLSMLFISHDLAVVRSLADRVAVMYRGQLVEIGSNHDVFAPPFHPYTLTLLAAVPSIEQRRVARSPAAVASSAAKDGACAFSGRCPWQIGPICEAVEPPWRHPDKGSAIRCHLSLAELREKGEDAIAELKRNASTPGSMQ